MTLDTSQQEKIARITIDTLNITRDHFERVGKLNFAEAHVISFDEQGEPHRTLMALDMPPPGGDGRAQMAMLVQQQCLIEDAVAVLFISEGWEVANNTPEEQRKYPDWSKHPRRKEIVFAVLETYAETVYARMPVIRPKTGKVEKTFEIVPLDRADLTGLFARFLPGRAAWRRP